MPRETNAAKRERAVEVCERLNRRYGPVECFLDHENPFRLLIAVLLSAQTTDVQVNKVTPRLFAQWPTPEAMAGASVADVADTIKSLGFYKSKAKHAVEAAQMIVADYGGEVPADMKELVKLPGVGRKTANIVLNVGFGIVEGIAVDTHVNRIAHRLMLSPRRMPKSRSRPSKICSRFCRTSIGSRSTTSGSPLAARSATLANLSATSARWQTFAPAYG